MSGRVGILFIIWYSQPLDQYELYARGRKDTGDNYMLGHEWLRTDKKRTLRPGSYQRLDLFNEAIPQASKSQPPVSSSLRLARCWMIQTTFYWTISSRRKIHRAKSLTLGPLTWQPPYQSSTNGRLLPLQINLPAASKLINNKYSGWLLLKEVFFHLLVALGQGAGTSNDPFRS